MDQHLAASVDEEIDQMIERELENDESEGSQEFGSESEEQEELNFRRSEPIQAVRCPAVKFSQWTVLRVPDMRQSRNE